MTATQDTHEPVTATRDYAGDRPVSRHRATGAGSGRGRAALGRQLTALAVVPPACAALLGILAFTVLLHASHRSQPLQGRTLAAVLVLGLLLLVVVVGGFVWAGRVARSANAAVEIVRVPVPVPAPQPAPAAAPQAPVAAAAAAAPEPVGADRGVFVHLSHRLQSLVHRQIQLLDTLENDVEEPDLLKGLFGVDHLATRMRRHAENLAVLGGAVPRRQWTKPVSVMEVLRSAVSETLDYARVQVIARTPGSLNGYAVADVIHLLAELVENATTFSPPDTKVVLRTQAVAAGLVIEIDDRGLGMSQPEYDRLNALLREPAEISVRELLEGARIGLYVVAQLARRHQIAVKLQTNITGGTQALVVLPKSLLAADQREIPAGLPAPAPAPVPAQTPTQAPVHAQPAHPAAAPVPVAVSASQAPMSSAGAQVGEPRQPMEAAPAVSAANPAAILDDAPPPTGRPVYGIDGALPAPRRAGGAPAVNPAHMNNAAHPNAAHMNPAQAQPRLAAADPQGFGAPSGSLPMDSTQPGQQPRPSLSGYGPSGSPASSVPDPRRPPLPRRRPQEHLAAPLSQSASNPADRVGEGLTPNLMADFRRGLALGATDPQNAADPRNSTEPHSATETHGGRPHEHPPTQEGH